METLSTLSPLTWMILIAGVIIFALVVFSKVIKIILKVAVVLVILGMIAYALRMEGLF